MSAPAAPTVPAAQALLYRAAGDLAPARTLPGGPARLVVPGVESPEWGLADERRLGFLAGDAVDGVVDALAAAGLRGRGGAGFPAHVKWRTVADASGPTVVVANGHEGEPASAKDRWLLTRRPHLVLDGLLLAARVVGADRAVVYVSSADSVAAARRAVAEVAAAGLVPDGVRLEVFRTTEAYVAGEESAVCRAINGGPALPLAKPPRVFESGVDGRPTLVSNVETLAQAAWIVRHGARAFRSAGTDDSAGTALFTLTGAGVDGAVVEAPLGSTVGELFAAGGAPLEDPRGLLMGGWFGGVLHGDLSGLACSHAEVAAVGSGLGCASITALGPGDDVLAVATELSGWYAAESARQCGVCRNGTKAIHATLTALSDGDADPEHREKLARWGTTLPGRGACSFLDGAATLARSVVASLTAPTHGH
ncbi:MULTISPECIES: NADH-ubiquinone oxidoreductase-F iron-sulfur binding region domain-containing protein [unclassified Geodermatophilus]|uniref:NADH-ubiquinone oxidoreductase-F iron-sulfur binding region domain-containing protein n=1 Tax=unclassified Geodermatophilus TaxID=2637632 RepID=UPI003EEC666C